MIKALIIEDEAVAARNLSRLLQLLPQQIEVVATYDSVAQAVAGIPTLSIDLIFMDIHLSDGNAFQIFEQIAIKTPIIFTTAYDQYSLKAFKQHSVDYLLKPIHQNDLENALDKFQTYFNAQNNNLEQHYHAIANFLNQEKAYKKQFLVQVGKKLKPIKIENIAYFLVKDKTTFICTFENRTYPIDASLAQLEGQLDPAQFFRVNRQHLISNQSIIDIYYLSTTRLKINLNPAPNEPIFVTIEKIGAFKRWLG